MIIDEDDDQDNCVDPGASSGGTRRRGDGNDNHDGDGEVDKQGSEIGTGKGKGTNDGKGKGKGKEKGNCKGNGNGKGEGILKRTPGGDDISCISSDPNFCLKHPGVPDGSDGSDGTSYALTENYPLPVAQATGRVAYVPPLLCGDVYTSSERHMCYTLRRGCSYAEAVFQESIRP